MDEATFDNAQQLFEFNQSENELNLLPKKFFSNLQELEVLNLNANPLKFSLPCCMKTKFLKMIQTAKI